MLEEYFGITRRFDSGEWSEEPDFALWFNDNYRCIIKRTVSLGSLCGYVDLPKDHKLYGKDYDNIDVNVHGGLTYADYTSDDMWRIGFDCAHAWDKIPYDKDILNESIYRTFDYVTNEVNNLVEQIKEYKGE